MSWFERMIRPPDDIVPNPNDPADVPPSTVGPDQLVTPGDPSGVVVEGAATAAGMPPRIIPSAWSGWPAEWWPPSWNGHFSQLTGTAWACLDKNASVLSTMPPYLVDAAPSLDAGWLTNPDPDHYTSWEEFAKRLFWDYQGVGEAFVVATAWYATGFPARFHILPPWSVNAEIVDGMRRYSVGQIDYTDRILHIRYLSSVDDAHGHGPLEAGATNLITERVLQRYASQYAQAGGVPTSILTHPEELTAAQSADLQAQWVQARSSTLGEPAVLSGGVTFEAIQTSPKDMALVELSQLNQSHICVLLGIPPFLMGLPSGGDSMTYSNVTSLFDYHWRQGLRPMAQHVMSAMSGWLLPRGTTVEVNRDAYIMPGPLERAQTAEILNRIGALSIDEIRAGERLPAGGAIGLTPAVPAPTTSTPPVGAP